MEYEISFRPDQIGNCEDIKALIRKRLPSRVSRFTIIKSFVDVRRKPDVRICYRVTDERFLDPESSVFTLRDSIGKPDKTVSRPLIIGFGPAGMFAGLILAGYGLRPVILELGADADKRSGDIRQAFDTGIINPASNVLYGEGGAGTFSDGKLYSGISSYKAFINSVFVRNGAPEDIFYDSHPHVGTDILTGVVKGIRKEIEDLGGEVLFGRKVTGVKLKEGAVCAVYGDDFEICCDRLIVAAGHGSRDLYENFRKSGIMITAKPFSVGVRIEHLRSDVDICQYGFDTSEYINISAASYKFAVDTTSGKLYTFCMCPGGFVISSADAPGKICTNGMSLRARDAVNSNSALLVPVAPADPENDVFELYELRDELERKAFILGGGDGRAPYMTVRDFLGEGSLTGFGKVRPSFRPGVVNADIRELFDDRIYGALKEGIILMGKKASFFKEEDAVLTAVEGGSSSPVRMPRDPDSLQSISVKGIYPCGEGAGYAGGIMSSAVDGIKCADSLVKSMLS